MPRPKPDASLLIRINILEKGCELVENIDIEKFNKNTLMKVKCCINSNHIFTINISSIISKKIDLSKGCPHCINEKRYFEMGVKKEDVEKYAINNNLDYEPKKLFYNRWEDSLKFTCKSCQETFEIKSMGYFEKNTINKKYICKKCHRISTKTKSEEELSINKDKVIKLYKQEKKNEITNYLESLLGKKLLTDNKDVIRPLELDIYDEQAKIAIEFCGLNQHSIEYNDYPNYHKNKFEKCREKGIRLVTIFSDEWELKREICQSRLSHIFGKTNKKIGARETVCKQVDNIVALKFCEENHIQGKGKSHIAYGLYYNDELISVMTFSKPSIVKSGSTDMYDWELNRFCSKLYSNIIGGANKLLNAFKNEHRNVRLVTFCDLRWGNGNVYEKLGFIFDYNTRPGYYYVVEGNKFERKHRFAYTKKKLIDLFKGDPTKTEEQLANENGLFRIYDCGHMRFHMVC
jgi:hypothetical protein